MPTYRVQHAFHGSGGTTKDFYTNTFYVWRSAAPTDLTLFGGVADVVSMFWEQDIGSGIKVSDFMSRRTSDGDRDVKIYDMANPLGSPPVFQRTIYDPMSTPDVQSLPEECAVCLSYNALGLNKGRRRGRVYIGPLNVAAMDDSSDHYAPVKVNSVFGGALMDSAAVMNAGLVALGFSWRVFSKTDGFGFDIVQVSVDNAFDTIRNRGTDAGTRWSRSIP